MGKRPPRVPELRRQHTWVVMGEFEIAMSEFDARRAVEAPEDFALNWKDKAKLMGAHGPGCRECGVHAREALGTSCEGPARLRRFAEEQAAQGRGAGAGIALPGRDF